MLSGDMPSQYSKTYFVHSQSSKTLYAVSACVGLLLTCLWVVWTMDVCCESCKSYGRGVGSCVIDNDTIQNGRHDYTRSDLLHLRERYTQHSKHSSFNIMKQEVSNLNIPTIIPRKRGRRGGIKARLRRRFNRPPIPSVILTNARSLNTKFDELRTLCQFDNTFREACLIAITETYLHEEHTDEYASLDNFSLYRSDRSRTDSGKAGGGGCCLYVNNNYCTDVTVHERLSTPLYDMLCVSMRPFYLPREFSKIMVCVIYVPIFHQGEKTKTAASEITAVITSLQNKFPEAPVLAMGDLNACSLSSELPSLSQYVNISTRLNKTLDVCYGTIPDAYSCIPLPKLGRSDHQTIHLRPKYKPVLKRVGPQSYTARTWSEENIETLRACFDCTDWTELIDPNASLEQNLDTVNGYIHFCMDSIMPAKKKKRFPNTKPWFSTEIYKIFQMKRNFLHDPVKLNELDREARSAIRRAKRKLKNKTEDQFKRMNFKSAYDHLKTMMTETSPSPSQVTSSDPLSFSKELNAFYNRFDKADYSADCSRLMSEGQYVAGEVNITLEEVRLQLRKVKPSKAAGPDGLPAKLLHKCADSLAPAFHPLFQQSVDSGKLPRLWKSSTIVPVPKKPKAKEMNNFRPVALTPLPMKCLEKIMLKNLMPFIEPNLDPLQFAYRSGRGVEDAIATLLHKLLLHLESPGCYARILFADFSSAFNTMQRHILISKLQDLNVPTLIVEWVLDFLSDRRQQVKVGETLSPELISNTGAPQGCVLSPFLYITYTNNCTCSENCTCVKFADDSAILGLISENDDSEDKYFTEIDNFATWCSDHHLELNVTKTKELIIDFRDKANNIRPVKIGNDSVEQVEHFKYLGLTLDSKLNFKQHVHTVQKKGQQRLHVLRRLRSFDLHPKLLQNLYRSILEPILTYCGCIFFPQISISDRNKIMKISNSAEKIYNRKNPSLSDIDLVEKATIRKAHAIVKNEEHPLNHEFTVLPSGKRYRTTRCKKAKYARSFVPTAIKALNANVKR